MQAPCPVCASKFTAYVRDVPTIRTRRDIQLFTCLECQSFWNPSGYKEDDRVSEIDYKWGLSVKDRNEEAGKKLFATLEQLGVNPSSVAEIGCGIGTLLTVAKGMGKATVGYDVNRFAIQHAVETNMLDAHCEIWTADTKTIPIDLYLCISVLEHIDQPRILIENLCKAAIKNGAALYISVPFLERASWPFILNPDPAQKGTPFFDNDVHVVHFSVAGLIAAMTEFGMRDAQFVKAHLWHGVLAKPK